MIIDEINIKPDYFDKVTWDLIRTAKYNMKAFVFDGDASRVVGDFAHSCPDLIIDHRQFAIPPYEICYVEYDSREFFKSFPDYDPNDITADMRVGYLFIGYKIFCFSNGPDPRSMMRSSAVGPVMYEVYPPGTSRKDYNDAGVDSVPLYSAAKLALLLGTTAQCDNAQQDQEDILKCCAIRASRDVWGLPKKAMWDLLTASAGDVRNCWAFLLWLNQPARIKFSFQPASHRIQRGKRVPMVKHNTVEIKLGRTITVRQAFLKHANRIPPIKHDVRGHFAHRHGAATGCTHQWPMIPNTKGQWECTICHRLRYWIHAHSRGELASGQVIKDYEVIT